MKEPAHLALHCWSWRAGLARSGHAEHRQSRAAGYVAGAAPTVPGRLVAERGGGRMRALEQTGREVGRGNASLAKGLAPRLATKQGHDRRSEEHTSELQSLMRISYAVFCLKKKKKHRSTKIAAKTTQV